MVPQLHSDYARPLNPNNNQVISGMINQARETVRTPKVTKRFALNLLTLKLRPAPTDTMTNVAVVH